MAEAKRKSNLLTGEDPESAINMKYCEAIKKKMDAEMKKRANLPDEIAKRKTKKKKKENA